MPATYMSQCDVPFVGLEEVFWSNVLSKCTKGVLHNPLGDSQ